MDFLEEAVRMKEAVRFYEDRLRPKKDMETGATEDEIDRLEFENEILRQDKNRYRDENIEMKAINALMLEALKMVSNFNWKNNRTHLLEIVNAALVKASEI